MNIREYAVQRLTALVHADDLKNALEDEGGANDGCTIGDILAEMPANFPCGADCQATIDSAALFLTLSTVKAHGTGQYLDRTFIPSVLHMAFDACACFIRG